MSGDLLAQQIRRERYRQWKNDESPTDNGRRRPTGSRRRSSRNERTDRSQTELGSYLGTEASSEAD